MVEIFPSYLVSEWRGKLSDKRSGKRSGKGAVKGAAKGVAKGAANEQEIELQNQVFLLSYPSPRVT